MDWEIVVSFQIHTLTEGRAYEVTPPATTTSAILHEYDVNMLRIMDVAPGPLTILVDVSAMHKLSNVSDWAALKFLRHRNMGTTLLVGMEHRPVVRFFVSVLAQMFGRSYKVFANRDQALDYLREQEVI
jgi:hypothetical protein